MRAEIGLLAAKVLHLQVSTGSGKVSFGMDTKLASRICERHNENPFRTSLD